MPIKSSSPPFLGGTVATAITPTGGIAAAGGFSGSPRIALQNSTGFTTTSTVTPSNTTTYISEIIVPYNVTLTGVQVRTGSGAPGANITVGLADSTGAPIAAAKSASTAGGTASSTQLIPFAVAYAAVGPAKYFIMVQWDTAATSVASLLATGIMATLAQTGQTYGTFASFTPPTAFAALVGANVALY